MDPRIVAAAVALQIGGRGAGRRDDRRRAPSRDAHRHPMPGAAAGFAEISTTEVLNRTWHVEGASVRPDHRMVAHTGFLTRARLLER